PDGSSTSFKGFFGKESDERMDFSPVTYLNIDQEMGYHVIGSNGMYYLNRHEFPKYTGVENQLVINYKANFELAKGESLPPLIVVTMPKWSVEETGNAVEQTSRLKCDSEKMTVLATNGYLAYWSLADSGHRVTAHKSIESKGPLPV